MKPYLFFFVLLLCNSSYSQNGNTEVHKLPKTNIGIPDTLSLNHSGIINSKIDTLYFKNLESENGKEGSIWHDIISIIGILLAGFLGWLSQFFLKGQEKNVNSHNLKEVKRIQHIEQISSQINDLALCDPQNSALILSLTSGLRNYSFNNNLYISKKYEEIINKVCDYYTDVSADYRMKNISIELDLWNQFKILFNK